LLICSAREKVLTARRAGIRRVILPKENEKDLRELPDNVRAEMEFIFVERVEDSLSAAIPGLAVRMREPKAA
jgi:ATP-dependent Lon protease